MTPTVCKASAGAVEHLLVARVPSLAAFIHDAAGAGRTAIGADAERGEDYATLDWPPEAVLVLGSEGTGLRPRVREACAGARPDPHGRQRGLPQPLGGRRNPPLPHERGLAGAVITQFA